MKNVSPLSEKDILAIDRAHIWHPYSRFNSEDPLFVVKAAKEVDITLEDDRRLVDGMASWWSVIHGYKHPELNRALSQQAEKMSHVMFGGLTHEPAARLAKTLVRLAPQGLDKVFFSDSGSVAVEVALKMALQYWQALGRTKKKHFFSLRRGYHGDTFAAMSVCDPDTGMHHLFANAFPRQYFVDAPPQGQEIDENYIQHVEMQFEQHAEHIAAFILEPIVQGAGGMRFYSPVYLQHIKRLCDTYHVLLIADEIATGFGRTGKMFACEHASISPDIMCVGKALTGGYLTLAATLCSTEIADGICSGEAGVFMHGPTYMANPLACALGNASLALLENSAWQDAIRNIETQLNCELAQCSDIKGVSDVRTCGAIGVVEMEKQVNLTDLQPAFVDKGVWLRPFGKNIYTMPAYIISPNKLSQITQAIADVLLQV